MPCCGVCRQDLKLTFFGVKDFQNRTIDVERSFNPKLPFCLTLLLKLVVTAWAVSILVTDLYSYSDPEFYLAYLTHWAFVVAILYFLLSFGLTLFSIPQQPTGFDPLKPGFLVRLTWGMFSTATTLQFVVTLLYWLVEYDPEHGTSYKSIMKHGGFATLIVMEGQLLLKIPVRLKHFVFVFGLSALYLVWTLIHAYTNIGNPTRMDGDPETDDDSIYESLSWRNRPQATAVLTVLSLFVVTPLLFGLLWSLSLCGRRYVANANKTSSRTTSRTSSAGKTASGNYSLMSI